MQVRTTALPTHSLLTRYVTQGGYTDCFVIDVPGEVSHARYVEAFYTTWLFKLERVVLKFLVAKPSTDLEARELAAGSREKFAAWSVEARAPEQLLARDFQGKTCSWLMTESGFEGGASATRLYFGSGIVPRSVRNGERRLTFSFRALLPFHQFYSRSLLRAAASRVLDRKFP
jgi:hypothetical protein